MVAGLFAAHCPPHSSRPPRASPRFGVCEAQLFNPLRAVLVVRHLPHHVAMCVRPDYSPSPRGHPPPCAFFPRCILFSRAKERPTQPLHRGRLLSNRLGRERAACSRPRRRCACAVRGGGARAVVWGGARATDVPQTAGVHCPTRRFRWRGSCSRCRRHGLHPERRVWPWNAARQTEPNQQSTAGGLTRSRRRERSPHAKLGKAGVQWHCMRVL